MSRKRKTTTVLVLRGYAGDLSPDYLAAIEKMFNPKGVEDVLYFRIDPVDYKEHAKLCRKFDADMVILPAELPIPTLAMKRGVPHLNPELKDGTLVELEPLAPKFKPFNPRRKRKGATR